MLNPLPRRAPEIKGITHWINSEPLTIAGLKGKVVLVDFWTYSCINCIRTQPYLNAWYAKYKDKGLEIIGVHTPEFEFEKNIPNVERAVKDEKITYPVAMDNNYATWNAFDNHYWPAKYLIDQNGQIVYTHFGEGDYDEIEQKVQALLGLNDKMVEVIGILQAQAGQTAETYLGYERGHNFMNQAEFKADLLVNYTVMDVEMVTGRLGARGQLGRRVRRLTLTTRCLEWAFLPKKCIW